MQQQKPQTRTQQNLKLKWLRYVLRKAKPPKPNMSFKQHCDVCVLRNDSNIVIVSADKGKATVVMDRSDYDIKVKAILQDGQCKPLQKIEQ